MSVFGRTTHLADLYQAGLVEMPVSAMARDIDARANHLASQPATLIAQRHDLTLDNKLRRRLADFAKRASDGIGSLYFDGRQKGLCACWSKKSQSAVGASASNYGYQSTSRHQTVLP